MSVGTMSSGSLSSSDNPCGNAGTFKSVMVWTSVFPAVMGGSIGRVEQGATSDLEDDAPSDAPEFLGVIWILYKLIIN